MKKGSSKKKQLGQVYVTTRRLVVPKKTIGILYNSGMLLIICYILLYRFQVQDAHMKRVKSVGHVITSSEIRTASRSQGEVSVFD